MTLPEITHSLGFLSRGQQHFGGNPGVLSLLDSFLERGDGTALFSAGGNYDGTAADLISDDAYSNGPNATAAIPCSFILRAPLAPVRVVLTSRTGPSKS